MPRATALKKTRNTALLLQQVAVLHVAAAAVAAADVAAADSVSVIPWGPWANRWPAKLQAQKSVSQPDWSCQSSSRKQSI